MADLEELVDELSDEVQEAGFRDFGGLADELQRLGDDLASQLNEKQSDALELTVEILSALDKSAREPG